MKKSRSAAPVMIEFARGSRLLQRKAEPSPIPALDRESPETFVQFSDGKQIPVPTDQIIVQEASRGAVRIGLGGMSFEGVEGDHLVFWRVRELWPEEALAPDRDDKLALDPSVVSRVYVQGTQVWPTAQPMPRI